MDTKDIIEEELGNDSFSASSLKNNTDDDWNDINDSAEFNQQSANYENQNSHSVAQPAQNNAPTVRENQSAYQRKDEKKAEKINDRKESKPKRKASNAYPVSFINMFLHQILFFFPILGFFFIFISLINRKANKNIKTMALTAIIWQFVFIGIFSFFLLNKGIGYILGWMEEEMGWIKAVQ